MPDAPRTLVYMRPEDLPPDAQNPKTHDDAWIARSITEHGIAEIQTLDERTGLLIAGHGRRDAYMALEAAGGEPPGGVVVDGDGRWLVPVLRGWASRDDAHAKAALIGLNRGPERGGFDEERLSQILSELAASDWQEGLDFAGYSSEEFDALLVSVNGYDRRLPGQGDAPRKVTWEPDPPAQRSKPTTVEVLAGDCLETLKKIPDASVDAVVTDPPYGLEFMGKAWDSFDGKSEPVTPWRLNPAVDDTGSLLPSFGTGRSDMHAYQEWVTQWAGELLRVLKPGGHLLAFGGTRTYHRLASGIEDAGFDVRDSLHWMYGSGFPKSLNVSYGIDKRAGAQRSDRVTGEPGSSTEIDGDSMRLDPGSPVTPEAAQWEGWGTALKPAHEPILLARKPLEQTTIDTVLKYGTGALNIDGTRVDTREAPQVQGRYEGSLIDVVGAREGGKVYDDGRWPANILFTHAPGCTETGCVDGCPVAYLDAQSGESKSPDEPVRQGGFQGYMPGAGPEGRKPMEGWGVGYGDAGGASRFFTVTTYGDAERGMPVFLYVPKASTAERNTGTDGLPEREVNEELAPGDPGYDNPRAGAGRGGAMANFHPTVKPVALMRWLIRLVTPPGGVVLDPFAGSGTTLVGAVLEGFDAIGCEKTEDYLPILEARVAWAQGLVDLA